MHCPSCGASVARGFEDEHVCDEFQRVSYELVRVRLETHRFDAELSGWLATPAGRFETYYAERQRRLAR